MYCGQVFSRITTREDVPRIGTAEKCESFAETTDSAAVHSPAFADQAQGSVLGGVGEVGAGGPTRREVFLHENVLSEGRQEDEYEYGCLWLLL